MMTHKGHRLCLTTHHGEQVVLATGSDTFFASGGKVTAVQASWCVVVQLESMTLLTP